jgi:hypothetical protein
MQIHIIFVESKTEKLPITLYESSRTFESYKLNNSLNIYPLVAKNLPIHTTIYLLSPSISTNISSNHSIITLGYFLPFTFIMIKKIKLNNRI